MRNVRSECNLSYLKYQDGQIARTHPWTQVGSHTSDNILSNCFPCLLCASSSLWGSSSLWEALPFGKQSQGYCQHSVQGRVPIRCFPCPSLTVLHPNLGRDPPPPHILHNTSPEGALGAALDLVMPSEAQGLPEFELTPTLTHSEAGMEVPFHG